MEGLLQRIYTTSNTTKKDSFGTTLKKNFTKDFLQFSTKRALCTLGHIFNKVYGGKGPNPDTFET